MKVIDADCRVSVLAHLPGIDSQLKTLTSQLVQCQNTLEQYMEEKRLVFPRFFFLSDDDLLELLGQARFTSQNREIVMQAHIKKLFPGATGVNLAPDAGCITAILGQYGEKLVLDTAVDMDVPIEKWLQQLEKEMRGALHTLINKCLPLFDLHGDGILNYPTQVLCLVQSIRLTEKIEKCIATHNLHELKESINKELNTYLKRDNQEKENLLEKHKLQTLILQCYHYLEISNELIENSIASKDHWQWKKHLRFYMENDNIYACMGLAKLPYTYEYLSTNIGNLVQTQLTDQCFLILTQALHLGLAGNPFGPAGTGKTESVKALGGLLGRLVLVFNCDEGMDKITIGRLLSGLALSGAWGCFDEFNRLEEKTLSDISRQFGSLLDAMGEMNDTTTASLNDKEIVVSSGCGVFVTMNPAGGSYGGRRNLPESINRLLRPCAMWQPNTVKIASALLATHGYTNSQNMAEKMIICFEMAKSLLTKSHHYDWGLRALKTVIGSCGSIMKEFMMKFSSFPNENEQMTMVIEALKLNTLSKLNYEDYKRFESILNVVFPDSFKKDVDSSQLMKNLKDCCEENNFIVNDSQIRKCIELYNQLKQRMGVVLVGSPGSGKSSLYNLLKSALIKSRVNISSHIICPKAMSRVDLLGFIDNDTRQWSDGVISTVGLQISNQPLDVWSWVICDGDIDPEWIESLNSVLDDNRLLTLPSGWRIQFGNNVNFIFETDDLKHASPATITRMGIILLSEEECCYQEVIKSWLKNSKIVLDWGETSELFIEETLKKALDWASINSNDFLISYHKIPMTQQILSFLNNDVIKSRNLEEIVAIAIFKSMGCVIKPNAFNNLLEQISEWTGVSSHALLWNDTNNLDHSIGPTSLDTGMFYTSNRMNEFVELISPWIENNQHFIIFGPSASGKSMVLNQVLKNIPNTSIINLQCTPILEISHIIHALKQNSAIRSGGSVSNRRIVLIVKSLHRAKMDKWKSSEVQSFFLQLIHHGGFWQRNKGAGSEGMHWFNLQRLLLIFTATMDDSESQLYNRLNNSLRIAIIKEPDKKELFEISQIYFNNIIENLKIKVEDQHKLSDINSRMFEFYNDVMESISNEVHYKWSSRDLMQWCQSLCYYKLNDFSTLCYALYEEAICIFKDRLISIEDENIFDSIIQKRLRLNPALDQHFTPNFNSNGLILELTDTKEWTIRVTKVINQCNNEVENGTDAFGDNGIEQSTELRQLIARVGRVIGGQNNGLVLVGVVGVGRRAAAKIAAESLSAKHITLSTPEQFYSQIKNILTACGCEQINTLLVLEEAVVSDKIVLGMIEALISNGDGKSLVSLPSFKPEIETLISQMKTPNNEPKTFETFLQNIQKYLGIVLLFDSKQNNLREIFKSYPFLYQRCRLVWLDSWKDITMKEIPKSVATNNNEYENCKDIIFNDKLFLMHSLITQNDLNTPLRYMTLFHSFRNICFDKKQLLEERKLKLESGVKALTTAQQEVASLKADAAKQQIVLGEKQTLANEALNQIGTTMQSATSHKQEMEVLKKNTEIENIRLQERKKEIEAELSEVEPIIQEARAAVGDIKPESLSEVRSLRAPPEPVRDVLEAVLRLMGIADTSWHSMKTFLSKRGIKDEIRTFDATNISSDNLTAVEKLITMRAASFTEKNAKRASVACAPLASWVLANVKYANVLHKIAPLETEQRKLTKNLTEAELQIKNLSVNLDTVDEKVASLKQQLNEYTKQATEVEINLSTAQNTINKAEKLVDKLSSEFQRWFENLQNISRESEIISLGAAISAGFVTYLTNENEVQRLSIIHKWKEHFPSEASLFSVKKYLLTHDEEIKWIDYGLPTDSIAIHNGMILNEFLKTPKRGLTPVVIDPNDTAITWLSKLLGEKPKDIILQHDPKFLTILQHAIRFGKILIVKELSYIDDSWSSLLRGFLPATMHGINAINPSFRLLLFSRDSSLLTRLSVRHKSLISIINFTPQLQGLTDQLIMSAVKQEQPELQMKLLEVNSKMNHLQIQQEELEIQLLNQLSSGDILHNEILLESLDQTQKAVAEISNSLIRAGEIANSVNKQCELYKPLAAYTASAALAISSLIYQYPLITLSLQTVNGIFLKTIARLRGIDYDQVARNVIVGLLERVLVALNKDYHYSVLLYLIHKIYPDEIQKQEWDVLTCNIENYTKSETQNYQELPRWISEDRIPYIYALKTNLPDWYSSLLLEDESLWKKFATSGEWAGFPTSIHLSQFQKILLTWALKPMKFTMSLLKAVSQILGVNQLLPGGDLITAVERWGTLQQPILVIGSSGTDPIDQIKARAANIVGINNYKQVWLSEINDVDRTQKLTEAMEWVKKYCGWLVISAGGGNWSQNEMYHMLKEINSITEIEDTNARIWIVVENASVPYLLTSYCINVVMEAPTGVKNNLLRTLSIWGPHQNSKLNDPKETRMEFSLALAHSIIQERCAYIPQGWRYNYGFSWGDVDVGVMAVRAVGRAEAGGFCNALYSGRVYWEQDMRLLSTIFEKHFDESVMGHTWKPLGMDISLPMSNKLQDYLSSLTKFPNYDDPGLLSLPQNIQLSQEQQKGKNIILNLKFLTHRQIIEDLNKKTLKKKLSPILGLWKKLNSGPDSLIKSKISDIQLENAWDGWKALAMREWENAIFGVHSIHQNLAALHSTASNDSIYQNMALDLIADKTPPAWMSLWNGGHLTASAFITGFCERAYAARQRIKDITESIDESQILLSSFFEPNCLFYAFCWESAKRLTVPPEELKLISKWDDKEKEEGKIILSNLSLEGAVWEGGRLQPCRADTPSQTKAPPISLQFLPKDKFVEYSDKNQLEIPIFNSSERKDMVFKLNAPSADQFNKKIWLLNSTALII